MGDHAVAVPSSGTENIRTRQRTISAVSYDEQYVIPTSERVVAGEWISSSFRIPARAATSQVLAALWVGASSAQLLAIRDILIDQETIAAKTVINPLIKLQKMSTTFASGTAGTKNLTDSSDATDTNITCAFDASADGTNSATALAAGTLTGAAYSPRFTTRMHTSVGVSISGGGPIQLARGLTDNKPIILRPSQGIAVSMSAAAALVAADFHWAITIIAEEFTLP